MSAKKRKPTKRAEVAKLGKALLASVGSKYRPVTGSHIAPEFKKVGYCGECGLPLFQVGETKGKDRILRHIVALPPPCSIREQEAAGTFRSAHLDD